MFSWFCSKPEAARKIYPEYSYNWYLLHQPPFTQKLLPCDKCKDIEQFPGYNRLKIKSKDIAEIMADVQNQGGCFRDVQFGVEQVTANLEARKDIEWKRFADVVKNGVYSVASQKVDVERDFKSKNKALQVSLALIARTHPHKLSHLRSVNTHPAGLYQFKLYRQGLIHNVIVDDWLPCFKGYHLFSGPVNEVEVWPMLLEKAIAKLCGGYPSMPEDALQVMEMICCGAIKRDAVEDLAHLAVLSEAVGKGLSRGGLVILLPKADKKMRQYGLNVGEIYQIVQSHKVTIAKTSQQHTLYEIISQNRMCAWNGRYGVTDADWKLVSEADKARVFHAMAQNRSFVVLETDIGRTFQELVLYTDTQTMNKDWLEGATRTGQPSYCKFTVKYKDEVFLRLTTGSRLRQHLIAFRVGANEGEYEYVGGNFCENSQLIQSHVAVEAGEYLVCIIQDGEQREAQFILYLSSGCRTSLAQGRHLGPDFLNSLFLQESGRQKGSKYGLSFKQYKQIGFAYVKVDLELNHPIAKLTIDQKALKEAGWAVQEPFHGLSEVLTSSSITLILRFRKSVGREQWCIPKAAFTLLYQ